MLNLLISEIREAPKRMSSPSKNTHGDVPELARDKRGLGLMLISVSSIVSMAIIGVVAAQLAHSVFGDNLDSKAQELENFSTAAGSVIPDNHTK